MIVVKGPHDVIPSVARNLQHNRTGCEKIRVLVIPRSRAMWNLSFFLKRREIGAALTAEEFRDLEGRNV
jgi:hypothetical protein